MGRKKKEVEKPTEANVNIKEGQKYTGSVNIRLVKDGHTIQNITKHNNGSLPLFSFLVNCLASNWDAKGVPGYINLGYTSGNEYTTATKSIIAKTSQFISNNDSAGVPQINYQFTIPTIYLQGSSSSDRTNVKINTLRLYNQDNVKNIGDNDTTYSAEIKDLDPEIKIPIADLQKYTMFVTWSLYITN